MESNENESQIQVTFFTKEERYAVADNPFTVPASVTADGLSSIINSLLRESSQSHADIEFEFLLDGELLRSSLALLIDERGISTESALSLEYHPRCPAPQPHHSLLHDDWVSAVQAKGQWILSGCYDNTVHLWTVKGEHKLTVPGHMGPLKAVSWIEQTEQNRQAFVSGGMDERLILWEWDPVGNSVESCTVGTGHTASVDCIAVSPSNTLIASGGWDNNILLWNPTQSETSQSKKQKLDDSTAQKTLSSVITLRKHTQAVSDLCWPRDSDLLSVSWDHNIYLWDVEMGSTKETVNGNKANFAVDLSLLNNLVLVASADRHIRIYDLRSKEGSIVKSTFTSHHGWVNCARWSKINDKLFISGGHDRTLKMWDIRSNKSCLYNMGCQESVLCCDWSIPRYVVSGGCNNAVSIYKAGDDASPEFLLT